jgi:hypothetical protein
VPRELTDFTPFGYLRNTAHHARAWGETFGGNLRTSEESLGVEWVYPVGRDATSRAGISLQTTIDSRLCAARADFDAVGLTCDYHSCLIFGCWWQVNDVRVEARWFLVDDDALGIRVTAENVGASTRQLDVRVVAEVVGEPPPEHVLAGLSSLQGSIGPGEARIAFAVLGRAEEIEAARSRAEAALARADAAYVQHEDDDTVFFDACPRLTGDWPAHWAEGLHHDFQTTRSLVQPAGGIFRDVWPSWMVAWPRVVFAEGTLDMLRLAYADPALAKRAVATLLRDAPESNVPCVFRDGEYNMVAADGSRCGTSPAWCLPFLNLELLYLRTLDRAWLAEIYPFAEAYLDWWLTHRVDSERWLVYKCTWESGEDGNPRLDPSGSGDADISAQVRPVELQATLAHAASVMAFFATELGRDDSRWRELESVYRERTAQLFDVDEKRYRDHRVGDSRPDPLYWGVEAMRFSAQSLTPLLVGLPLPEAEVWRHATPPWSLWPSWTWSLVESAAAARLFAGVGRLAFATIDRVYRTTTRRELGSFRRPMPGCSPEFWPEDWRTYGGSDAYGWGATTANLLIRHLVGFKESRQTDGWVADLTPALPPDLLVPGARYAIEQLTYRDRQFDLTYTVQPDRSLSADLVFADAHHTFSVRSGERLTVRL